MLGAGLLAAAGLFATAAAQTPPELPGQPGLPVAVTLWLEGPYDPAGDTMAVRLSDVLSTNDPYGLGASVASPDFFTTDPTGQQVVDWVWLRLRTGDPTGTMHAASDSTAALLLADGSVVAPDGGAVAFGGVAAASYYVVVGHRNHLAVMSAAAVDCSSGPCAYAFGAPEAAYGGSAAQVEVEAGVWALVAGDGDGIGQVQNGDKNTVWAAETGSSGYLAGDFDLNAQVQNTDKNAVWSANVGAGSQVPALGAGAREEGATPRPTENAPPSSPTPHAAPTPPPAQAGHATRERTRRLDR